MVSRGITLAVLLAGALAGCQPGSDPLPGEPLRAGHRAPAIEEITLDGAPFRLEDLRGQYVLVDFWGTWCPPCLIELPFIRRAYDEWPREKLAVVGVFNDDPRSVRAFLDQWNIPWPQVPQVDGDEVMGDVLRAYRVDAYPSTYLIDPDGVIVAREAELRGANLAVTLQRFLGESGP